MINIINELNAGSTEYKDEQIIQRPPTSLQLRASRALSQLLSINDSNIQTIHNMQICIDELFQELQLLKKELDAIRNTNMANVCEDKGQTSNVECSSGVTPSSDSNSEGCGTTQDGSTSTN